MDANIITQLFNDVGVTLGVIILLSLWTAYSEKRSKDEAKEREIANREIINKLANNEVKLTNVVEGYQSLVENRLDNLGGRLDNVEAQTTSIGNEVHDVHILIEQLNK